MPNAQQNHRHIAPAPPSPATTPLSFSSNVNAVIYRLLQLDPRSNSPEYAKAELERAVEQCTMTDVMLILYTIAEKVHPEYVQIMIDAANARVDRESMALGPSTSVQYEDKATSTK